MESNTEKVATSMKICQEMLGQRDAKLKLANETIANMKMHSGIMFAELNCAKEKIASSEEANQE